MAILGYEGTVELSREWASPTALADERLQRGTSPSLDLSNLAFQSGDDVLLVSLRGVPLGIGLGGAAPCPDGHAFWPDGATAVGPALTARTTGGAFWSTNTALPFWESVTTTGLQQTTRAYIHRDELNDVRFYSTELDAINGGAQSLIPLRNVSPGPMLILPGRSAGAELGLTTLSGDDLTTLSGGLLVRQGNEVAYAIAALALLQSIADLDIPEGEQPAENLAPVPQILTDTAASADSRGWLLQCDLTSWVFETDVAQLDETAIGQDFGESAKGLLRGAGNFNANLNYDFIAGSNSSVGMLRLVMLTGQGSKARAKFQIADQRTSSSPAIRELLYYETDILLNKTTVNTQADDIIRVSADFVATGRVQLVTETGS
jgi:hypothetical protein